MLDINMDVQGHLDLFIKDIRNEIKELEYIASKKAEVGIFESKDDRTDGKSNAEIGYAHEYGKGVPRRSFLEVPADEFQVGVLNRLNTKNIDIDRKLLSKLASMLLEKIKEEFETNGHGSWRPLSENTRRKKNKDRSQLLRDTKQLYRSLSKRVVDR